MRELSDIDFFGLFKQRGHVPSEQFNFSDFPRALRSYDPHNCHVDIWLHKFEMCYVFDFSERLNLREGDRKRLFSQRSCRKE